jgi:hypothetical protein
LNSVANLLKSLADYLEGMRDRFTDFERIAKENSILEEYNESTKRKNIRTKVFQHESSAEEVCLSGSDKFRVEVFFPIIDSLIRSISQRSEAYIKVNEKFAFLTHFNDMTTDELLMKSQQLVYEYTEDFDTSFPAEMLQFAHFAPSIVTVCEGKPACASDLLSAVLTAQVESTFPNVAIALRIFLTLMCTNCTAERSFSKLKLLKSKLRSTMTQERLSNLAIMSIESDVLRNIDFTDVIKAFSVRKSRKKSL